MKGTGGGEYQPIHALKTEEEIMLFKVISLSVEGLQSQYDNDGLAGTYNKILINKIKMLTLM